MKIPPLKIFIIYAREDGDYKAELVKSLKLLQKNGLVETWHDRNLLAGDDWDNVIRHHLETAHIILPIISRDFFSSDYIEQVEIEAAFQRYERGEAYILPIIARPCKWTDDPRIARLQALPKDGLPIAKWPSHDDAYNSVYDGIKAKIAEIQEGWKAAETTQRLREEDAAAFAAARTADDFEAYLKHYTLHVAEARQALEKLRKVEAEHHRIQADHDAYAAARTIPELEEYLKKYTLHINHARRRINILKGKDAKIPALYLPDMVFIKGGDFEMGDVFNEGYENERPVHGVTLSDFYMGKYAVTFEEYDLFCEDAKQKKPNDYGWGRGKRPVIDVSWEDAVAYTQWLCHKTGLKFRLPTEAEWEYAAREGGRKVRFGNGKDIANPKEINFYANKKFKQPYSVIGKYRQKTVSIGNLNCPNALGLHDMSGNVWEWCADWYGDYSASAQTNPTGPTSGTSCVRRGGSWSSYPQVVRVSHRSNYTHVYRADYTGFRLARTI